jgi:hypothetical protein
MPLPQELRTTRPKRTPEEDMQINLVKHIQWRIMPDVVFFHVPNGGARSKASAGRLKAMGVRAGVLDLIFLLPGPRTFLLELKHGSNRMSDEQEALAADLDALGIEWACAWTLDDALKILEAVGAIK